MAAKAKRFIVMHNGTEHEIIGEDGRYWKCANAQFKKGSTLIKEIRKEKAGKKAVKAE